jgi:hypothetical protein
MTTFAAEFNGSTDRLRVENWSNCVKLVRINAELTSLGGNVNRRPCGSYLLSIAA